tara:strand:+ start:6180 stop:6416 length:237 start_codon:yes stop_codon:yes gene_type:complete
MYNGDLFFILFVSFPNRSVVRISSFFAVCSAISTELTTLKVITSLSSAIIPAVQLGPPKRNPLNGVCLYYSIVLFNFI